MVTMTVQTLQMKRDAFTVSLLVTRGGGGGWGEGGVGGRRGICPILQDFVLLYLRVWRATNRTLSGAPRMLWNVSKRRGRG